MAFSVKLFTPLLDDMTTWIVANQDKITDFNEGSVIRTFCEAISIIVERIYIDTKIGFNEGFIDTPFQAFDFVRELGQKASGNVVFSRSGTSGDQEIASGTIVSTTDGTRFETTADGQISNGNTDSASIPILASTAGKDGNVPANTIIVIVTPIEGVETVDNAASTTGGQDQESDDEYTLRFQQYIIGLGKSNEGGLIAGAKSVTGIRSASTVEHFPPVSSYNVTMYIDDGAGNASAALIAEVLAIIIGTGTVADPGYKAAGVNLRVLAPTKVTIAVTVEVTDNGLLSQTTIEYNVNLAIENYINNLTIGDDVIVNKIRQVIMDVDGVADISLTVPASNTAISDSQIARTGTITITFS
ncbi:hypothetical protein LCGC14_2065260 [marine sediment metagenome]|uniref:Uncharacterized protein n=1 Tax=marine sediment metagenome TaxID=412755 RepID=A0A0F9F7E7_9ZZZZ